MAMVPLKLAGGVQVYTSSEPWCVVTDNRCAQLVQHMERETIIGPDETEWEGRPYPYHVARCSRERKKGNRYCGQHDCMGEERRRELISEMDQGLVALYFRGPESHSGSFGRHI